MNDQERGFLDAIIDEPDDDTHRLVYSDWLEDHGKPERAEFIRLQIEHAKLGYRNPRSIPFPRRIRQLLDQYKTQWVHEIHPEINPDEAHFVRGFLDEWDVRVIDYVSIGDEVHRRAPVTTYSPEPELDRWFVEQLAEARCLEHVRHLFLGYCELTDSALAPLLSSAYVSNLHSLHLDDNPITARTMTRLLETSSMPRLRALGLNSTRLGTRAFVQLSEAPLLGRLEDLDVTGCALGRKGIQAFAKSTKLGSIRELAFARVGCRGEDLRLLLDAPSLEKLAVLSLYSNPLGQTGVDAIARASGRFEFRRLALGDTELDPNSLAALQSAKLLSLTNLELDDNSLGDEALAKFLTEADLPALTRLHLDATGASTKTIQALLDKFPDGLVELSLAGNPLDDDDVVRLVQDSAMKTITELALGHDIADKTAVLTDTGGRALLESKHLDKVVALRLRGATFSEGMREELQGRFGEGVSFD